jgi:hypothetical protein
MKVGEMWAYRERAHTLDCAVVKAEILQFGPKRSGKVRIRLQGGELSGLDIWVPAVRLRVPWDETEAWLRDEKALAAARQVSEGRIGSVVFEAAQVVFFAYPGPGEIMLDWPLRAGTFCIADPQAVAADLGLDLDSLLAEPLAFIDRTGEYYVTAVVGERLAHLVAQKYADEILARVANEEERLRQAAVQGRFFEDGSWSGHVPPERCAEYLREREPVFAQVREWCGQPAVERFDELGALRAEVLRLRELVTTTAERLEAAGHSHLAKRLRSEAGRPRPPHNMAGRRSPRA